MSIQTLAGFIPEWFTPESQEKETKPARFKIAPLSTFDLLDMVGLVNTGRIVNRTEMVAILRRCLIDWDGVEDAQNKPLECKEDNFAFLPLDTMNEVCERIGKISNVSEDDRKN